MPSSRTNFIPGRIPSSYFYNNIQVSPNFQGEAREDYYRLQEKASWGVNQRDGIKDYEIDPRSTLGAIAYYGIIKSVVTDVITGFKLGYKIGEANTFRKPGLSASEVAIEVSKGSVVTNTGEVISWEDIEINVPTNGERYGYVDKNGNVLVAIALPPTTQVFVPLFKLVTTSGSITEYQDLRPHAHLNIIPANFFVLSNTESKTADYSAEAWERVLVDSNVSGFRVYLPAEPLDGDTVAVLDIGNLAQINPIIIDGNGRNISRTLLLDYLNVNSSSKKYVYVETELSWFIEDEKEPSQINLTNQNFEIRYQQITQDYQLQQTDHQVWFDSLAVNGTNVLTLPIDLEFGFNCYLQTVNGTVVLASPGDIDADANVLIGEKEQVQLFWLDNTQQGGNGIWKVKY